MKSILILAAVVSLSACSDKEPYYERLANSSLSDARTAFMNNDKNRACINAGVATSLALSSKNESLYRRMKDTETAYCS